jgi:hypothetical protein
VRKQLKTAKALKNSYYSGIVQCLAYSNSIFYKNCIHLVLQKREQRRDGSVSPRSPSKFAVERAMEFISPGYRSCSLILLHFLRLVNNKTAAKISVSGL